MYHISEIENGLERLRTTNPEYDFDFVFATTNDHLKKPHVGNKGAFQIQKKSTGQTKVLGKAEYTDKDLWRFDSVSILTRAIIYNRLECA
jgi:hypothetical protein